MLSSSRYYVLIVSLLIASIVMTMVLIKLALIYWGLV
jgi:hypothetical protein